MLTVTSSAGKQLLRGDVVQLVKVAMASEAGPTTPPWSSAGEPHRGRITDQEKRLVREHLDEVNARLREKGLRTIDPADARMKERYGVGA